MRKMCVKETVMVVAAAFVVMNVQERRLEKGKDQGQVHQDSSGKPHTHILQSRYAPRAGICDGNPVTGAIDVVSRRIEDSSMIERRRKIRMVQDDPIGDKLDSSRSSI